MSGHRARRQARRIRRSEDWRLVRLMALWLVCCVVLYGGLGAIVWLTLHLL